MGDRDGADEREEEEPPESKPDDSAAEDQQVPSSTAADAKDEDGDDGEAPKPSVDRQQSPSDDEPADWWEDHRPEDVVDETPTESASPPDDASSDGETDGDADDDPSAASGDESTYDDVLEPATRRNQVEKVEKTRDEIGPPTDDGEDDERDDGPEGPDDGDGERAVGDADESETNDGDGEPEQARSQSASQAGGAGARGSATARPGTAPGADRADDAESDEQETDGAGARASGGGRAGMARGSATARPSPAEQRGREPDPGPAPETAPDDEEMPLTEHVEEMALRLLAVGLVMFGVAGIVVFYADNLINFLWYSFLGDVTACPGPNCDVSPRVYHPLSLVLARLKVSTLVGLIIALPVGVYQTYRFMRPGLYPRERRYYLAAVPTSVVLAAVGVGFAYFAVLPSLFAYFTQYSEQAATTAFGLTETFNLIVLMLGFFALIFQIPLLVMLAIMMGVTSRQWMEDRRLYFWGGFAAVAFVFSPDPTGMAPLIVAVTMIILFEGTLTLLRWTGTGSPIPTAEEAADARPLAYLAAALGGYIASSGPLPPSYYGTLPTQVTDALANAGGPIATPAILAGVLIALFEISALLLRRFGRSRRALRARLAVDSARIPIWLGAAVVGYFGSPNPTLVIAAENLALPPVQAGAVAVGLVVLYELFVTGLRWRAGKSDDGEAGEDSAADEI